RCFQSRLPCFHMNIQQYCSFNVMRNINIKRYRLIHVLLPCCILIDTSTLVNYVCRATIYVISVMVKVRSYDWQTIVLLLLKKERLKYRIDARSGSSDDGSASVRSYCHQVAVTDSVSHDVGC